MKTVHARIEGRVQGVFFRDSTRTQAKKLDLKGWVTNMADGTVEAEFQGSKENIEVMLEWLGEGSPHAVVSNVLVDHLEREEYTDFHIRY